MTLIQVARGHLCTEESVTGLVGSKCWVSDVGIRQGLRKNMERSGRFVWEHHAVFVPTPCVSTRSAPCGTLRFLGFSWLFMAFHLSSGQVGVGEIILSNKHGEVMRHPTQV